MKVKGLNQTEQSFSKSVVQQFFPKSNDNSEHNNSRVRATSISNNDKKIQQLEKSLKQESILNEENTIENQIQQNKYFKGKNNVDTYVQIIQLQQQKQDYQNQFKDQENIIENLQKQIQALSQDLIYTKQHEKNQQVQKFQQLEDCQNELNFVKNQNDELIQQNERLKQDFINFDMIKQEMHNKILEQKLELQQLCSQLNQKDLQQNDNSYEKIQSLTNQNQILKKDMKSLLKNYNKLEDQNKNQQNLQVQGNNKYQKDKLIELYQSNKDKDNIIKNNLDEIKDLKQQLQKFQLENQKSQKKEIKKQNKDEFIQELQNNCEDLQNKVKTLEMTKKELKNEQKKSIFQQKKEYDDLQVANETLKLELKQLQDKLNLVNYDLDMTKKDQILQYKERKQSSSEVENKQNKIKELKLNLSHKQNIIDNFEKKLINSESQIREKDQIIQNLEKNATRDQKQKKMNIKLQEQQEIQIQELYKQISDLQSDVKEVINKNDSIIVNAMSRLLELNKQFENKEIITSKNQLTFETAFYQLENNLNIFQSKFNQTLDENQEYEIQIFKKQFIEYQLEIDTQKNEIFNLQNNQNNQNHQSQSLQEQVYALINQNKELQINFQNQDYRNLKIMNQENEEQLIRVQRQKQFEIEQLQKLNDTYLKENRMNQDIVNRFKNFIQNDDQRKLFDEFIQIQNQMNILESNKDGVSKLQNQLYKHKANKIIEDEQYTSKKLKNIENHLDQNKEKIPFMHINSEINQLKLKLEQDVQNGMAQRQMSDQEKQYREKLKQTTIEYKKRIFQE